jgi:hypothetical protein
MKDDIQIFPEWLQPEKKKVQIAHAYHKAKIEELQKQIDRSVLRGKRKPTRFFMENEFVSEGYMGKLPKLCTLVYCAILKHGNTETQVAWPSLTTIQELTGDKNRNYVANAVRLLVECSILGVVQTKKGFKTLNLYYFKSVDFWKSIAHVTKRVKLKDSVAQYPDVRLRSIRKPRNRSINVDTLTNQNNKSPNSLTSIGDVLKGRMQKWQVPPPVAIPKPSGHSVVRTAYEGEVPWRQIRRDHQEEADSPDRTGELQDNRSIPEDTTHIPVITGNLREQNLVETPEEVPLGSISIDTAESPFKNGEKPAESEFETHTELGLDDITQEDLGPGTATL